MAKNTVSTAAQEYLSLLHRLRRYGWNVATYSPTNGRTRYRLLPVGMDYFQCLDGPTVLGRARAIDMMECAIYVLERVLRDGADRGRKDNG